MTRRTVALVGVMLLSATSVVALSTPLDQLFDKPIQTVTSEEYERMQRAMPLWVAAVTAHEPGVVDAPAREVSGWSGFDLESVLKGIVLAFERGNRFHQPVPGKEELAAIVKRGAMLHADIALIVPADELHIPSPLPSSRQHNLATEFSDARQAATYYAGVHLEVGRTLLDVVRRTKWRDDGLASLWYAATTMALLRQADLADAHPHLQRAVQVLDRDARILFLAGVLHEQYAGGAWQRMAENAKLPTGFRSPVGSPHAELLIAEKLFTRSLRSDPKSSEVRLHHARVLGQLSRHTEAAAQLRTVANELKDPVPLYYAALFLGEEEAALGRREAARQAFERAATLFPTAQSPLVGLSELARRYGDRAAAQAAMRRLFALPRATERRQDPWLVYYQWSTGAADALMGMLRSRFRGGGE